MKTVQQLQRLRPPPITHEHVPFNGGLDTTTPPLSLPPGFITRGTNVEVDLYGGYQTSKGYERFDGQPSPSDAIYSKISITLTGVITVGDTVTGVTSGATGYVIVSDAEFVVLTKVVGVFVSGEDLNVSGSPQATTTSIPVIGGASSTLLKAQYANLAADVYRADIAVVPGSGDILGVVRYNDITYAFRNNSGGTAADIYKSSASGWVNVPLYYELPFTQGLTNVPAEGSEISQSGGIITATVKRVALTSGSWDDGTAEGNLIVTAPSGGDFGYGYFNGDPAIFAANGVAWTSRISAADNNWSSVAYGNGVFVAVSTSGSGNRAMYSGDGKTWQTATTPADNGWTSVCFGNGLFVAVANSGTGNRVMTSPDGQVWTLRTSAADNSWLSVCYGNGLFVAVASTGTGNRVMTSPDGITWTSRTSAANNSWSGVAYGGGVFVAVAPDGANRVMTSSDGITWAAVAAAAANSWVAIAYDADNYVFAAVSVDGVGNRAMWSSDSGATWTIAVSAADNLWSGITWANGLFVAVAQSGTGNRVMTSPDAATWTIRTSAADNSWTGVTSGAGLFVAVAAITTGDGVMTSPTIPNRVGLLNTIQTAITLAPSGKYSFVIGNLTGSAGTRRIYGADGVSRGFEFDGDILVPIHTGMVIDTPKHVTVHKNHLFFTFDSSVQHSSIGLPYEWSAITGAAELAMGDTVTGFQVQPGGQTSGALAIFTRNRMSILYGSSSADWNLVQYREEVGAIAYTTQDVGFTTFLDDQGIMGLQTVQEFGNFAHSALSNRIRDYLTARRGRVSYSCISRDKSQYRLFFTDGSAVYMTVGSGRNGPAAIGMTSMRLTNPVLCVHSSEDSDGSEKIFFGSSDGFVYQMEKGTSHDGAALSWDFRLAYNFSKSPRMLKRYRDLMIEVSGNGYAAFDFTYQLGYNSSEITQPGTQSTVTNFTPAQWDSFTWDNFIWDGTTLSPNIAYLEGEAENIAMIFSGGTDYHAPIKFSGVVLAYSPRRNLRQ